MEWKRTHECGLLNAKFANETVVLNGWVNRRRDHGGVIFVDLRDRSGLVQVVFNPELLAEEQFAKAEKLRSEFVISVKGIVKKRPSGQENPELATGEIEVYVNELIILSEATTPPFPVERAVEVDESLRLKYRYLDLRRKELQNAIRIRYEAVKKVRNFLDEYGFYEIETPILTKSTPEGARDYIIPSRVHLGEFYALPQSPQMFKQLLMMSGFEKYYQIARCFRDEDLRADRQPEFTQIDVEMSFVDSEDIMNIMEKMIIQLFEDIKEIKISQPIPRMTYQEAMESYGTDRPDTRFGLKIKDLTEQLKVSEFKVFSNVVAQGGVIKGINAKGCGDKFSRREIDQLVDMAMEFGAKGLVWIAIEEDTVKSPIAKFLSDDEIDKIKDVLQAEPGDLLLLMADKFDITCEVLGRLRLFIGEKLDLINEEQFNFLWVIEWPLLVYDEDAKRFVAAHHPFTAPVDKDIPLLESEPGKARAKAYDLVLNGIELGGGSMRIFQKSLQEKMFKALGFSLEDAYDKFGSFMEAFDYGTPPHGGIAFGLDRLIMMLTGVKSIRDVIAFPKTASALDLLMGSPSIVTKEQLQDLKILLFED